MNAIEAAALRRTYRDPRDPAGQETEQIQRGFVRPVQILDDQDHPARGLAQLVEQPSEQGFPARLGPRWVTGRQVRIPEQGLGLAAQQGRNIEQGPERPWGGHRIAGTPQHAWHACPGPVAMPCRERANQAGFAYPRLATEPR